MKLSKTDKKIFAKGRSAGRTTERNRSKGRAQIEAGTELFAAWAGQKFLAGRATPYFKSVPLHYSLGGAMIVFSMMGRSTDTKDLIGAGGLGLVGGQLGVEGFKNQSALPGMGG